MPHDVLDVLDSEVEQIFGVMARLQDRARFRKHNYNDFEREIRESFAEIGFTVNVSWYEFESGGAKQEGAMPEVTVTGRTDPGYAFDPDRQVHEVTSNILDIPGGGGVIKTDPSAVKQLLGRNGHGHGHSR